MDKVLVFFFSVYYIYNNILIARIVTLFIIAINTKRKEYISFLRRTFFFLYIYYDYENNSPIMIDSDRIAFVT